MRTAKLIPVLILGIATALPVSAKDIAKNPNIFFIKRNKNTNEVHYDARVQGCKWRAAPVDGYWRELERGPTVFAEIGSFEKLAYGYTANIVSDTVASLEMTALPDRAVTASLTASGGGRCTLTARISINNQTAELIGVFVHATPKLFGIPVVDYVDVLAVMDGKKVFERIAKTDLGNTAPPPAASAWTSGAPSMGR